MARTTTNQIGVNEILANFFAAENLEQRQSWIAQLGRELAAEACALLELVAAVAQLTQSDLSYLQTVIGLFAKVNTDGVDAALAMKPTHPALLANASADVVLALEGLAPSGLDFPTALAGLSGEMKLDLIALLSQAMHFPQLEYDAFTHEPPVPAAVLALASMGTPGQMRSVYSWPDSDLDDVNAFVMEANPELLGPIRELGWIMLDELLDAGRFEVAIAHIDKFIRLTAGLRSDREAGELLVRRGGAVLERAQAANQVAVALENVLTGLRSLSACHRPSWPRTAITMAGLFLRQANMPEAIAGARSIADWAITELPTSETHLLAELYFVRGVSYELLAPHLGEPALVEARDALRLAKSTPHDQYLNAKIANQLANVLARLTGNIEENIEEALELYQEAEGVFSKESHTAEWAGLQSNLMTAFRKRVSGDLLHNMHEALMRGRAALDTFTKLQSSGDLVKVHSGLANVLKVIAPFKSSIFEHSDRGHLAWLAAAEHERQALLVGADLDERSRLQLRHNLGTSLVLILSACPEESTERSAYFEEASRLLESAAAEFGRLGARDFEVMARQSLALAYRYRSRTAAQRSQDLTHATQELDHCLELLDLESENPLLLKVWCAQQEVLADLISLGRVEFTDKRLEILTAILGARATPTMLLTFGTHLAELYFQAKDWGEAVLISLRILEAFESLYADSLLLETRDLLVAEFASLSSRCAYALAQAGDTNRAFEVLDSSKLRLAREWLTTAETMGDPQQSCEISERASALRQLYLSNLTSQDQLAAITELEHATAELVKARGGQASAHASSAGRISKLCGCLSTGTAMVYLTSTTFGGLAIILESAGSPRVVWLPEFKAEEMLGLDAARNVLADGKAMGRVQLVDAERLGDSYIGAYLGMRSSHSRPDLEDRWRETLMRTTEELQRTVGQPLLAALGPSIQNCILVPQGLSAPLPVHLAFRTHTHSPAITYAPNLEFVLSRDPQPCKPSSMAVVAVNPLDSGLAFAEAEASKVTQSFGATARRQACPKLADFLDVLGECDCLHVIAHASVLGARRFGSRIELSSTEWVELRHLLALPTSARGLAVLSACEAGWVEGNFDDGLGLPMALLRIGFHSVIAASWLVDDLAAALFFSRFYELWPKPVADVATALQETATWLRCLPVEGCRQRVSLLDGWPNARMVAALAEAEKRADVGQGPFASPEYWGNFAVYGS